MAVVDSLFVSALTPPTVAGPLPEPKHCQDPSSELHGTVLRDRDDDGGDAVPTTPAPPQWPRVFPGL
jgi:hypothetical protein